MILKQTLIAHEVKRVFGLATDHADALSHLEEHLQRVHVDLVDRVATQSDRNQQYTRCKRRRRRWIARHSAHINHVLFINGTILSYVDLYALDEFARRLVGWHGIVYCVSKEQTNRRGTKPRAHTTRRRCFGRLGRRRASCSGFHQLRFVSISYGEQVVNTERTLGRIATIVKQRDDLTIRGYIVARIERRVQGPVGTERVMQQALRDQHLTRTQHTTPATVARVLDVVVAP